MNPCETVNFKKSYNVKIITKDLFIASIIINKTYLRNRNGIVVFRQSLCRNILPCHHVTQFKVIFSGASSSDENSVYGDEFCSNPANQMSVITPRSSVKFTHSISLIFSGFLESHDHPRDPVRWSLMHVSIF